MYGDDDDVVSEIIFNVAPKSGGFNTVGTSGVIYCNSFCDRIEETTNCPS